MKKKTRTMLYFVFAIIMTLGIIISSCKDHHDVKTETIIIPGDTIGIGKGYLLVVNETTSDTILNSGALDIIIPHVSDVMNAKYGDKILMNYVPDDKDEKLSFTVRYFLLDETEKEISKNGKYEFTVPNLKSGEYKISWNAFYKDANHNIFGGGNFYIVTP